MEATKVISFRIPMQDYIKLLTKATSLKMSISDYALMKVYGPNGDLSEQPLAGVENLPATAGGEQQEQPKQVEEAKTQSNALSGVEKKTRKPRSTKKATTAPKTSKVAQNTSKQAKEPDNKAEIARLEKQIAERTKKMLPAYEEALKKGDIAKMKKCQSQAKKEQQKTDQEIEQLKKLGWKKSTETFLNGLTDEREKKVFASLID